jgi:hypothetical protein
MRIGAKRRAQRLAGKVELARSHIGHAQVITIIGIIGRATGNGIIRIR